MIAGQADQPLILALVVPVREEHRHESKRIEVLARRSTFLRINRVELEERPALGVLRRDREGRMLALHSDPLELLVLGVVDELLIRRRGLCEVNSLHRHERDRGTSVAAQALDQDDVIRAKTQRGEQTSRGDFRMDLGSVAILHPNLLAAVHDAVKFRRRTAKLCDFELATDEVWLAGIAGEPCL